VNDTKAAAGDAPPVMREQTSAHGQPAAAPTTPAGTALHGFRASVEPLVPGIALSAAVAVAAVVSAPWVARAVCSEWSGYRRPYGGGRGPCPEVRGR